MCTANGKVSSCKHTEITACLRSSCPSSKLRCKHEVSLQGGPKKHQQNWKGRTGRDGSSRGHTDEPMTIVGNSGSVTLGSLGNSAEHAEGAKGHKHLSSSMAEGCSQGREPQGTSILSCLWLRESLQRRVGELQVSAVGCHWQLGQ